MKFVTGIGENVSGYRSAIVFNVDDNAKVYLERDFGLQQEQTHVLRADIWSGRAFLSSRSRKKNSAFAEPGRTDRRYDHKIEESRAGASLSAPSPMRRLAK